MKILAIEEEYERSKLSLSFSFLVLFFTNPLALIFVRMGSACYRKELNFHPFLAPLFSR